MISKSFQSVSFYISTPLNPIRRDNFVHLAFAALVAMALLVAALLVQAGDAFVWLTIALLATLLATHLRIADGFWQLMLGFCGLLAATHGIALAFVYQPNGVPAILAGAVLAAYALRISLSGLRVAKKRDAEARLMDRRNENELRNGWLTREELARRRYDNHVFWRNYCS
ncbi:hypothetical protein [Microvirga pudoricolor]|uniref:hypothetical protein n=1 Tax=Microvirga pudoricolor TaxID=2778729 RepID=UPI00194EAB0F|nr:hypothetical protein [Microvirga pudoricolor]MBM6595431.1 hypothetical protein [Microvirga pudoricolor]